jgi:hypothetical protein
MHVSRLVLGGALLVVGCSASEDALVDPIESSEEALAADAKVEIKMSLAEVETAPAILGVDPKKVELRDVTFYDTADLSLFEDGIILRTRRVTGDDDDSTVKLRPLSKAKVDAQWFDLDDFKCEYDDTVGKRAVSSCSLTTTQGPGEIVKAARGDQALATLFTAEQHAFLAAHARTPDWSKVRAFGPIAAEVWKVEPEELGGEKVTVERWSVPGGARSLEVSVKVTGREARSAEKKLVAWIAARGLSASATQETKTKAALVALSSND